MNSPRILPTFWASMKGSQEIGRVEVRLNPPRMEVRVGMLTLEICARVFNSRSSSQTR